MMGSRYQRLQLFGFSVLIALNTALLKVLGTALTDNSIAITANPLTQVSLLQAVVLGIVQGLTEFLPISSTGHLIAVSIAFGWGIPSVALTAVLELGSIAAVLWYFWADLRRSIGGTIKAIRVADYQSHDFRLSLGIGLGTLPIIVFGLLLKKLIPDLEHSPLRSLTAIAIASIIMAILLGAAELLSKHQRNFDQVHVQDGIWMGLAQAVAVIPGVSRSGSTLTAGLFLGLERAAAARFSFLLAIPAITLAGLLGIIDVLQAGLGGSELFSMLIGGIASTVVSYAAIAWLLKYLQTQTTWIFVWYRLAFGIAILVMSAVGLIKNV